MALCKQYASTATFKARADDLNIRKGWQAEVIDDAQGGKKYVGAQATSDLAIPQIGLAKGKAYSRFRDCNLQNSEGTECLRIGSVATETNAINGKNKVRDLVNLGDPGTTCESGSPIPSSVRWNVTVSAQYILSEFFPSLNSLIVFWANELHASGGLYFPHPTLCAWFFGIDYGGFAESGLHCPPSGPMLGCLGGTHISNEESPYNCVDIGIAEQIAVGTMVSSIEIDFLGRIQLVAGTGGLATVYGSHRCSDELYVPTCCAIDNTDQAPHRCVREFGPPANPSLPPGDPFRYAGSYWCPNPSCTGSPPCVSGGIVGVTMAISPDT